MRNSLTRTRTRTRIAAATACVAVGLAVSACGPPPPPRPTTPPTTAAPPTPAPRTTLATLTDPIGDATISGAPYFSSIDLTGLTIEKDAHNLYLTTSVVEPIGYDSRTVDSVWYLIDSDGDNNPELKFKVYQYLANLPWSDGFQAGVESGNCSFPAYFATLHDDGLSHTLKISLDCVGPAPIRVRAMSGYTNIFVSSDPVYYDLMPWTNPLTW